MNRPEYLPRLAPLPVVANSYSSTSTAHAAPVAHTQDPMVTGTSVIAIKYKDGIMMAADTMASYGSMARFRDMERLMPVGKSTLIGASGEISDMQEIERILDSVLVEEFNLNDGNELNPVNIFEYLRTLMYHRRNKFNPLWNRLVVGGLSRDGTPFLGQVDLRGGTYTADTIATGYGAYLALPLLRERVEGRVHEIDEREAQEILEESMRVLIYRDARALNRIQIATVTAAGVRISKPYELKTEWMFAEGIRGYA